MNTTMTLGALCASALCAFSSPALADAVQWRVEDGGNGHWYEVMPYGAYATWSEAAADAVARGGYLATLTSQEEDDLVTMLYQSIGDQDSCDTCSSGTAALIGGQLDVFGEWQWVTGEAWDFTNWYPGEPTGGSETVLYLRCPGQWNDGTDSLDGGCRYAAIIEWSERPPVQWRIEDGGNGHWYQGIAVPDGISWLDADTAARSRGGHLATLTSSAEDHFVAFVVADPIELWSYVDDGEAGGIRGPWFGGQRREIGCDLLSMEWVTGEAWAYTRWYPGNPNADCTSGLQLWDLNGGRAWQDNHDDRSSRSVGYIVEYTTMPGTAFGACCLDGYCLTTTASDCMANGGAWGGVNSSCTDFDCSVACAADIDGNGTVDGADLSIVLGSWGVCP